MISNIEQITAYFILSLWVVFPLMLLFSVFNQQYGDKHLMYPLPHVIPTPPNEFKLTERDVDDEDLDEGSIIEDDNIDYKVPNYIQERKNRISSLNELNK